MTANWWTCDIGVATKGSVAPMAILVGLGDPRIHRFQKRWNALYSCVELQQERMTAS